MERVPTSLGPSAWTMIFSTLPKGVQTAKTPASETIRPTTMIVTR